MKKVKSLILGTIILLLTACTSTQTSVKTSPTKGTKPVVLTTFTIIADIARNVSGNRLQVNSITKVGSEIHGYQPTPRDVIKATKAQLIIENGLGLELWSKKFTASAGNVPTVVLSDGIEPFLIEGDVYAGKPNPHAWMSPKRAMHYVDKIVEAFIGLDPNGKSFYINNANIYKEKLAKLDKELRAKLNTIPSSKRVLVSCEGAFTYLAKDYGMEEAYLWPVNAESQVTPRRMLNLIKIIKQKEIPTIFCESTVSAKAQIEVAKESGAFFGGNFYVDSLSEADGPAPTFLRLLRHNVDLIVEGLAHRQ